MNARSLMVSFGFLLSVILLALTAEPAHRLAAQEKKLEQKKADEKKADGKKVEEKKVEEKKKEEPKKDVPTPAPKKTKKAAEPEVKKDESKDPPKPEEPVDPIKQAEKTLAEGKIKTDPAALLDFFKTRTLSEAERKNLSELISKLGNDDFDVRENASQTLARAGLAALPTLRAQTRKDDVEVIRRIEMCLKALNDVNESGRVAAAALLLAHQKVGGTPKVLLDYLPCVPDDEGVRESVRIALTLYSKNVEKADPLLVEGLTSKSADTRVLSAQVLGEALPPMRAEVKKLLQDPEDKVRYFAGLTLARAGDKTVVPELLKLLTDGSMENAYLVEDMMFQLLGDGKMEVTLSKGDAPNRKASREAWEKWWKEHEAKIDIAKLVNGEAVKGLTIIVEVDQVAANGGQGRVWECGADGKQRWEWTNVNGPVDVQVLPNGRFLLAEYYNSYVTERDREGKVLWTSPKQNNSTVSAQRLSNGNTLIATMNEVVEVKRDGTRVGEVYPRPQGTVYQVRQAKNGHTFILAGNELMELDRDRKEVRKVSIPGGLSGWAGFDFLPNGNFLIAYYGSGRKVAEVDGTGKVVSEIATQLDPTRAQRLRNGNVLVAGGNTMFCIEYDANKKEVFKVPTKGRPFSVVRY